MVLKNFKNYINKFTVTILAFIFFILFIDDNSLLFQRELNKEIKKLKNKKAFYIKEINKKKQELKDLQNEKTLEKYGREKLLLKKKDEDLFIIEDNNKK